jgi:hypothetical protein
MKLFLSILMFFLLSSLVIAAQTEDFEKILEDIDLSELPKVLKFLLGKPLMNVEITDTEEVYGFKIRGNKITDFVEGGIEDPNYIIKLNNETLDIILYADNPMFIAGDLFTGEKIMIEPQKFGSKIKFTILNWFI